MKKLLISLVIGLVASASCGTALAATIPSNTPGGLGVSPAIEQITLAQNQTSAGFDATISNKSAQPVVVYLAAQNFTALGENGAINFVGNTLISNPHGLANWISLGYKQVALPPGGSQVVPISILDANQLAPGGHYAAITYDVYPAVSSTSKGNSVSNNEALSTLIFLTTYGQGTQSIKLDPLSWSHFYTTMPTSIDLVFTNNGNTQVTPHGSVEILRGKTIISRGIVNSASGLVLPSTSRLISVPLQAEKTSLGPGNYTLKVFYLTNSSKTSIYSTSFLFINAWIVAVVVILVTAIILLAVRFYRPAKRKIKINARTID